KPGTLTAGGPAVGEIHSPEELSPVEQEEWTAIAASLASHSTHPFSQAVAGLSARRLELSAWREQAGAGLEAIRPTTDAGSEPVRLGSLRWLSDSGIPTTSASEWTERWSAEGASVIGLAAGKRLVLLIALQDKLKPHAREVVRELNRVGLATYLVTGDRAQTARGVARLAGIA